MRPSKMKMTTRLDVTLIPRPGCHDRLRQALADANTPVGAGPARAPAGLEVVRASIPPEALGRLRASVEDLLGAGDAPAGK